MTRSRTLALVSIVLVGAPACASRARVRAQEDEIHQLREELAATQKTQRDLVSQNESLRNEMFILHDRVETTRTALARTQMAPPKLEVVKLKPNAPESDPLAAKVATASRAKAVADPADTEGYDPSADEAEMFSYSDETGTASAAPVVVSPIPEMGMSAAAPAKTAHKSGAPAAKPVVIADASPTTMPAAIANTKTTGPKEDPMKLYQRAFETFQAKNYEQAQLLFQQFVNENPAHEYADNAYYWMGEIYYTQGEYGLAIDEFQKVPELYPGGNKVPDALLKLGLCYQGLNDAKNAGKTLKQLVDAYPQSNAATIGRQKLAALEKQEKP